jgi:hypothetical protein
MENSMELRIIQTWKTHNSLPPIFAQSMDTWRSQNPTAHHELVDDRFVWQWLSANKRKFPNAIHHGREAIRTVDMFRYCYLLARGGLYADLDFYCLRPVAPLIAKYHNAVVLGSLLMPPEGREHSIPNAWMYASEPGHPFWLLVLDLASKRLEDDYVERATGPILLRDAVMLYRSVDSGQELASLGGVSAMADLCGIDIPPELPELVVLHPEVLYPLSWGFPEHRRIIADFRMADSIDQVLLDKVSKTENTYAFTYWYHFWGDDPVDF